MELPKIATQEEWLVAREDLLAREEDLARMREAVNAERRRLPMVEITKDYVFDAPQGRIRLPDLFEGRRQLLVYHFWFEPGEEPCEGCSLWVSDLGNLANLHAHGTSLALVSRASSADIEAVKERKGWAAPWFATGSEFNADSGYVGAAQITVFLQTGNTIFRTYAVSGRQLETLGNHWTLLELTPLGMEAT